jgi:glycosyltransferase involved in cell wall biosynthesis
MIQGYSEAARALGHEVTVYACSYDKIPLNYSLAIGSADAVVFLFEWTTQQYYGDRLDLARLVGRVPRERRIVIDGDGNYNDVINVDGDVNHPDDATSRRWTEVCDSISDKICQPTLHPLRPNVRPFLFYAYNSAWEQPLDLAGKEFTMLYVGHSKFRWRPMERVLRAIKAVRREVGRIGVVGHGWDSIPRWANKMQMEGVYYTDKAYLRRLEIDMLPAVSFKDVIAWMSRATFNPVLVRPTFAHMSLVTPRLFETPAASTIPLLVLDEAHVQELYGPEALELRLPDQDPEEKILDLVKRPQYYGSIVMKMRRHLAEKHSHRARLERLIEIIEC